MAESAVALMDAATAHGAARCILAGRTPPILGTGYTGADYDWEHFVDFLHHLLLYDDIRVVSSPFNHEAGVDELVGIVNEAAQSSILSIRDPRETDDWGRPGIDDPVVRAICDLVKDLSVRDGDFSDRVRSVPVPYLYLGSDHVDHPRFVEAARDVGLAATFIPLAMFAYRGTCYAASARALAPFSRDPVVYLASPGRLRALQEVFPPADHRNFEYPLSGYLALLDTLALPPSGYDFSFLTALPARHTSRVTQEIRARSPRHALEWVSAQRRTPERQRVGQAWRKKLLGTPKSAIVGSHLDSDSAPGLRSGLRTQRQEIDGSTCLLGAIILRRCTCCQ